MNTDRSPPRSSDAGPPMKKPKVAIDPRRPLARGDACNACRSRKVRCPGERPTCGNCAKRSRQCVYSDKRYMLSVVEGADESVLANGRPNGSSAVSPLPFVPMQGYMTAPMNVNVDMNGSMNLSLNMDMNMGMAMASSNSSTDLTNGSMMAGPNSSDSGGASASTDVPLLSLSTDLTPLSMSISPASMPSMTPQPSYMIDTSFPFAAFLPVLGGSPAGLSDQTLPPQYADLDLDQLLRELERDITAAQAAPPPPASLSPSAQPVPASGPAEVTALEKEHLLWLYFNHQRRFCLEMHFATFWGRLQSPDPQEHPHPALLNAIYLVTCWASPSLSLRARENEFYKEASDALRQAVAKRDRLLDAARAGFLLSCYLYSKTRFSEAATTASTTYSIAIMCGLHIIPASRWTPTFTLRRGVLRYSFMYLERPKSQIELADRIYTFWSIFLLDRCAAVSQDWPPGLGVDRVCTPLPRPWSEYENPGDHLDRDETLFDVLQSRTVDPPATVYGQTIKGLEILYRCSQMGVNIPKLCPSSAEYDAVWGAGPLAMREKALLEHVLEKYIEQLPAVLKSVQSTDAGKTITNATGTLQFIIGGSQMFLHDTDKFGDPNELALAAARRMLGVIHLLGDQETSFDSGLLVVMIWSKMGNLLIRESLRLEDMGDTFGAAKVDAEVNDVIKALQARGKQIHLAQLQAVELEQYRRYPERHNPGCRKCARPPDDDKMEMEPAPGN